MGDSTQIQFDTSEWQAGLARLGGDLRVSLARSMAVAGGEVIRDEARARAPVGENGILRDAIYLAFREAYSTGDQVEYSVSWNRRKAPHGHLEEFGYWQPYRVVKIGDRFVTLAQKLPTPKWIPAHPFLRPAYDAAIGRALQAMFVRGRQRLPELLAGARSSPAAENVPTVSEALA